MNDLTLFAMLAWVTCGMAAGLLTRLFVPGREMMCWPGSLLFGAAGSSTGGLTAYALQLGTEPAAPTGWILSIVGAVVALLFYQQFGGLCRRAA
jgi:uncharacterized membrane protein YeaQ/YmgE (transglycosylase-associated protein family)